MWAHQTVCVPAGQASAKWPMPATAELGLVHGLVMPSSGKTRVASRALRRSAAAMLRSPWARRMAMARLRRLAMARGGGAGTELGGVLGEGGIADVVQRLDAPLPADPVGQAGEAGLGGGEANEGVHGHGAPPPSGKRPDSAGGPPRLGGVGGGPDR